MPATAVARPPRSGPIDRHSSDREKSTRARAGTEAMARPKDTQHNSNSIREPVISHSFRTLRLRDGIGHKLCRAGIPSPYRQHIRAGGCVLYSCATPVRRRLNLVLPALGGGRSARSQCCTLAARYSTDGLSRRKLGVAMLNASTEGPRVPSLTAPRRLRPV